MHPNKSKKLKDLFHPNDDEKAICLKMLAVITNQSPSIDHLLLHAFSIYDPTDSNSSDQIDEFGTAPATSVTRPGTVLGKPGIERFDDAEAALSNTGTSIDAFNPNNRQLHFDNTEKLREAARKLKYEEEKLRETENRVRNLEIERQQEISKQLLKEQAEQRVKEEEIRAKEKELIAIAPESKWAKAYAPK